MKLGSTAKYLATKGRLFTEDLEAVADRLDTAMRSAADSLRTGPVS